MRGENGVRWEGGRDGCHFDGLDELETMMREGGREGGRGLHLQGELDGVAGEDGGDDVAVLGVAVFQDLKEGGREGGRKGGREGG